jgi:hypothetical protein
MIRPVSSQLADFLRLGPTPASSDEVGGSAVNRRVASSNLARGAKPSLEFQKLTITSPSLAFAVPANGLRTRGQAQGAPGALSRRSCQNAV